MASTASIAKRPQTAATELDHVVVTVVKKVVSAAATIPTDTIRAIETPITVSTRSAM